MSSSREVQLLSDIRAQAEHLYLLLASLSWLTWYGSCKHHVLTWQHPQQKERNVKERIISSHAFYYRGNNFPQFSSSLLARTGSPLAAEENGRARVWYSPLLVWSRWGRQDWSCTIVIYFYRQESWDTRGYTSTCPSHTVRNGRIQIKIQEGLILGLDSITVYVPYLL